MFCHAQHSYTSNVIGFSLFRGHHETYIQEHMKETIQLSI